MESVSVLVYCDLDIIPSDEGIVFESPNDPKFITISEDMSLVALRKTIFYANRGLSVPLSNLSPKGLHGIFERFRGILHEGEIDKHVQFLIEGLFAIRKAKFQGYPAVRPEF
ncbi:hypothetical protein JHK84_045214 [Glycine max]|nr:hypothetical protein JHK86_045156 [Glycine max]KAG5108307.1 hypothetical protein JHK84_045214 [Glycine max]